MKEIRIKGVEYVVKKTKSGNTECGLCVLFKECRKRVIEDGISNVICEGIRHDEYLDYKGFKGVFNGFKTDDKNG